MPYERRVCFFIDILGFKRMISDSVDENGNSVEDQVNFLSEITSDLYERILDRDIGSVQITQFSDSFILSFCANEPGALYFALMGLIHLQFNYLFRGILLRGACAIGHLSHSTRELFGPTLIEAAREEAGLAYYPRIIIKNREILEECAQYRFVPERTIREEMGFLNSLINVDFDGISYIDYLNHEVVSEFENDYIDLANYIICINNKINELDQVKSFSIQTKNQWLKEKYNRMVEGFVNNRERVIEDLGNNGFDDNVIRVYGNLNFYDIKKKRFLLKIELKILRPVKLWIIKKFF